MLRAGRIRDALPEYADAAPDRSGAQVNASSVSAAPDRSGAQVSASSVNAGSGRSGAEVSASLFIQPEAKVRPTLGSR